MRRTIVVLSVVVAVIATFVRTSNALTVTSGDTYAVGTRPEAFASSDLNDDRLADLVTLNAGSHTASVLLADAGGGFHVASTPGIASRPTALALGDVNGDAKTDLVTVGSASGYIFFQFGDGHGSFYARSTLKTSSTAFAALALGDLNDDGRTDLVTDAPSGTVRVLLNSGGGNYKSPPGNPYAAKTAPTTLTVADMDGDRWPDVVAASASRGTVAVLRGSSTGALSLVSERTLGTRPAALTVADLDGDGSNDVAVAEPDAGAAEVLLGDGADNLDTGVSVPMPPGSGAIATGDMNADGALDLVVAADTSEAVAIALGDGAGGFTAATGSPYAVDGAPQAVAALDVDGDAIDDVVVARGVRNDVIALHNGSVPELDPSPTAVDFGPQEAGTVSDAEPVTASSTGLASTITSLTVDGDFAIAADGCSGRTIADGRPTCDVSVTFAPSVPGDSDGALTFTYGDGNTATVPLHGRGVDTIPPQTTLTGYPSPLSKDPDPTFEFASDDPAATFECNLDGEGFAPCESPYSMHVDDGDHTFAVHAIDAAGNVDPSPATDEFTVDTQAPVTTITDQPDAQTTDTSPSFSFVADDSEATFECRMDGAPFASCASPYASDQLAPGDHAFEVRATDVAGNVEPSPASYAFTVVAPDTGAPETTIVEHPSALTNDTTPTFRFISDQSGATFRCSVDAAPFADCGSPYTTSELAEGTHTFDVAAVDAAGNVDPTPDSFVVTIDVTSPVTSIVGPRRATRSNARFIFNFSENVESVWCSVDGTGFSECRTPYSGRALRPGRHVLRVRAVDAAGNVEAPDAVKRFTILRGR